MVRSNVYMICGRWIQTRKTLSIVSQHLCIRRARMFTRSETKPFTAHMPAHYYSAGGSLVYRTRALDQCAAANYSQRTAVVPNSRGSNGTEHSSVRSFHSTTWTNHVFVNDSEKETFFSFPGRAATLIGNMFESYSSKELGARPILSIFLRPVFFNKRGLTFHRTEF